jgi:hypothetical protein
MQFDSRAYLDARREVERILTGMNGKNLKPTNWGPKKQTLLERYCQRKWNRPEKLSASELARCQQQCSEYLGAHSRIK